MKKRMVNFLLSITIVSLSALIIPVYGKENNSLYAGAIKDINNILDCYQELNYNSGYIAYTTANVNIRDRPDYNAKVLNIIPFNCDILIFDFSDEWSIALYESNDDEDKVLNTGYINKDYFSLESCKYTLYSLSNNEDFKSFMSYKTITNTLSKQYELQENFAYTGNFGIRQVNGRYCIAIGTAFNTEIGSYLDLILKNGNIIECVVSDIKNEKDTLQDNITTAQNGCVSEFIVDLNFLNSNIKRDGNISSCCEEWESPVTTIKIYDKNIFKKGD